MPVDAALWTRLAPLLDTLLGLPSDERAAALAALPDDDLRTAAVRLLERIEETGEDFLEADGGVLRHTEHLFLYAPTPPAILGPYRLLRELGRGGMGVVFLAERNDGAFEQQVAIKVLRFADPARAERLDRERHILAVLDHPAIARLRDGGHTPDGQPYLVLDYVDGTPLLDYARERPLHDRLRLLVDAADAVAYAHQHLIVHRDLKPSNLLVDPSGQVKLLDFGIAKVLTDDDTITGGGSPFTPAYAAPEQRRGEPITTATDVYALGALLHELATGLRLERPPASTTMPSDVHAIVQRATEDAPADRYPSAAAFREDLLRYLSGQPIVARPPTFRYRATRFVQRNRLASVLAVLVAAALAVALAQGLRAQRALADAQTARDRAEATSGVLFTMLEGSDPTVAGGDTLSAHTLLERALAAQPNLNRFPDLRAQLLARIGTTLRRRGDWGRADTFLTAASQLTPDLDLSVESERAELARERSNFSDAEARYRAILAQTQQRSGAWSLAASFPMANLGGVLADRNQPAEAETLLVRALAIRRQHLPTQDIRLVPVLSTLGSFYTDHRRYREAEPLLREAVSIFEAAPRDDHTLL
ncbi:MAG: serine/threonine protein kinase, partial [Rhodothermales bacterium]|nr:serine/threonine protein kinase [Rhodothermales bacterium]